MAKHEPVSVVDAFADVVALRWPHLMEYSSRLDDGSFEVAYPSPHRADGERLTLLADPDYDEVIICFGPSHSHGGPWNDPARADYEFRSSIDFIDGILSERVVACRYAGYARIGLLEQLAAKPDWASVEQVRSWRGTHDLG